MPPGNAAVVLRSRLKVKVVKELRGKKTASPNGVSENGVLASDRDTEAGKQVMQYQVCGHVPPLDPRPCPPWRWPQGGVQDGGTLVGPGGAAWPLSVWPPRPQVLNEVVIDRGPSSYLSNVDVYLDGHLITTVQGDGMWVLGLSWVPWAPTRGGAVRGE